MKVEIICPLYNAADYIIPLHKSLLAQKAVPNVQITYVLTQSVDNTAQILDGEQIVYHTITREEFSHSLTREKFAMASDADIIVFITQDVQIESEHWLADLLNPIINGECEASFSRQISKYRGIERYTREYNYPVVSFVNTSADLATKGLKAFAFSDVASAVKAKIFHELNGYDGKDLPFNEDMYLAYKLINNGYRIKYCADSVVYHSHKFTLRQLYHRYYLAGKSMALLPELNQFGTAGTGMKLAKYVLGRAIKKFDVPALCRFLPDMLARYWGLRKGKKDGAK